jgi:acyl-CoA reductase-like NAD-dependent aldehyde dehydrogenase
MKTYSLFVDGEDLQSGSHDFSAIAGYLISDPRGTIKVLSALKKGQELGDEDKRRILGKFYLAEEAHMDRAIDSAYRAFHSFKKTAIRDRAQILIDVHRELVKRKDEFIDLLIAEGHPRRLAIWQFENMASGTSKENVDFYVSMVQRRIRSGSENVLLTEKPDGVILVIPPRNAPASNSFVALSSLITGNTLIIKPPQKLPISTIFLWREIVQKALINGRFPKGVLNIIQGNSSLILKKCLDSEKVKTFFIFGESEHGLELSKKVYLCLKKPILELSGNDIMMIWEDAKLNDHLLESVLEAFLGSSQICMVPKILLIHHSIYDRFVEFILKNISKVKPGLPDSQDTWLSPVGKKKEYFEALDDALRKGAKMLCGGKAINYKGNEEEGGIFIQPTLLEVKDPDAFTKMLCYQREIFFPLVPCVKIGDKGTTNEQVADKMIYLTDKNRYGLRVSIWIKNGHFSGRFINEINNCGTIRINSRHIGFSKYMSTHGGTGLTGGPQGGMNYMCLRAGHLQGASIKK